MVGLGSDVKHDAPLLHPRTSWEQAIGLLPELESNSNSSSSNSSSSSSSGVTNGDGNENIVQQYLVPADIR